MAHGVGDHPVIPALECLAACVSVEHGTGVRDKGVGTKGLHAYTGDLDASLCCEYARYWSARGDNAYKFAAIEQRRAVFPSHGRVAMSVMDANELLRLCKGHGPKFENVACASRLRSLLETIRYIDSSYAAASALTFVLLPEKRACDWRRDWCLLWLSPV
jgi:hypothetical protein